MSARDIIISVVVGGGLHALIMVLIELRRRQRLAQATKPPPDLTPSAGLMPESGFIVRLSDAEVVCERPDGKVERIQWSDLQKVEVITTSDGPFAPDVFWLLDGTAEGCAVPSGATGEKELLERLQALPGFDNSAVIAAMSCASDRRFLCWERTPAIKPASQDQCRS